VKKLVARALALPVFVCVCVCVCVLCACVCVCASISICMYVYIHFYVYIYICMYVCIHTHTQVERVLDTSLEQFEELLGQTARRDDVVKALNAKVSKKEVTLLQTLLRALLHTY
jgi:hypothetical protein